MKTKEAFTLIEVMVVLSILALVAVLAYNFFGNTMKEARDASNATKLYRDMRLIVDGWDKYWLTHTTEPPGYAGTIYGSANYLQGLLDESILTSPIIPPSDSPLYRGYGIIETIYDIAGAAAMDEVLVAEVPEEACVEFNQRFSTITPPLPTAIPLASIPKNLPAQCYKYDFDSKYRVIMLVRADEG